MTDAERQHLNKTLSHIRRVQELLHRAVKKLLDRSRTHDDTKLEEPEFSGFAPNISSLSSTTYESEDYKRLREEKLQDTLEHHYGAHRHHPEHHEDGIEGMTLIDIVEMLVDWKAASERHEDGDIYTSIDKNQKRFGYSDETKQILINTADRLF